MIEIFETPRLRELAADLTSPQRDVVPILNELQRETVLLLDRRLAQEGDTTSRPRALTSELQDVVSFGMKALPVPDEDSAWENIFEFREHLRDKKWALHRFLRSLATKAMSEAELWDEIEWMVHEYAKAMELHHLKASTSAFEAFVIPSIEVLENLVKFNWSKIAKGAIAAKRRKIERLETESRAPGRECAYIFEARRRFGLSARME